MPTQTSGTDKSATMWTARGHLLFQLPYRFAPFVVGGAGWLGMVSSQDAIGNDVDFYPKCDLMTDSFQIIPAGKFVSPALFDQIKKPLHCAGAEEEINRRCHFIIPQLYPLLG